MAPIDDGKYDTRAKGGRCVSKGPQIVMISGFGNAGEKSSDSNEESGSGKKQRLFVPYDLPLDIPATSSELNVNVPDDAEAIPAKAPKT